MWNWRRTGRGQAAAPPRRDEPGPSWFMSRVTFWRDQYARWWSNQPTVEQQQRLEDARARAMNLAALDEIARSIAAERVWLGRGREVGPLIGFEEWSRSTALGDERRGE